MSSTLTDCYSCYDTAIGWLRGSNQDTVVESSSPIIEVRLSKSHSIGDSDDGGVRLIFAFVLKPTYLWRERQRVCACVRVCVREREREREREKEMGFIWSLIAASMKPKQKKEKEKLKNTFLERRSKNFFFGSSNKSGNEVELCWLLNSIIFPTFAGLHG